MEYPFTVSGTKSCMLIIKTHKNIGPSVLLTVNYFYRFSMIFNLTILIEIFIVWNINDCQFEGLLLLLIDAFNASKQKIDIDII